jgi:hypothetical protein
MKNSIKIYEGYPSYQLVQSKVVHDISFSNFKFSNFKSKEIILRFDPASTPLTIGKFINIENSSLI